MVESVGDFLPQFNHPQIAFDEVVCDGDIRIVQGTQNIVLIVAQADQEVVSAPSFPAAPAVFRSQEG